MNCAAPVSLFPRRKAAAFSLIEMIGVLAIMAIVAAVLTPNLARRVSRMKGDQEDQALSILADGLIRAARTYQAVPGASTWATNVATMTGLAVNDVRYVIPSDSASGRVYLIHPAFSPTNSGTADPLWTQSTSGASSVTNARILIVSSHKSSLTLPVSSGKAASAAVFDAIWDWSLDPVTKAPPSGWPATWTRNGEYLHVQRVNLASSFHRVTFSNADFPFAFPSIQVGSATSTLNATSTVSAYYLQSTYLRLFKDVGEGGGMDLSQSLEGPANFLYESDRWRVP